MEDAIEITRLERRFGSRVAVAGIDLHVPAGCCFGLLGPNGAGKTTLIRLLLGLLPPTAGDWKLLGRRLADGRREALARVGAVVEEPRFHRHLTGRENLLVVAAARGDGADARIPGALARVGLTERADDRVGRYSLGMRQRLAIARCLLADPLLLMLDEPMNGLDPAGVLELRALFAALVGEGRTVVLSSHLLDEVERTCDRVAILDAGRIVEEGAIADIADRDTVLITCDQPRRAAQLLHGHAGVRAAEPLDDRRVRVSLVGGTSASSAVEALVRGGIAVCLVERDRHALEDRFLALTSPLGGS